MSELFVKMLNMSISASWIVLVVILIHVVLKKTPRFILCALWTFVGIRLVVPVSFKSVFSLIPKKTIISENILDPLPSTSSDIVQNATTIIRNDYNLTNTGTAVSDFPNEFDIWRALLSAASWIWVVGIAVLLLYAFFSWLNLKKKVAESVLVEDKVYMCDGIDTPFILGVFFPKIYLPSSISEKDSEYVIAHEKAHLKRFDHLWKPLGFLLLALYWFNPLMWVAYILLSRDIELACDEKVISKIPEVGKKEYSEALLNCSTGRRFIAACPLAFGEVGVKKRIISVLNYRKPAFWITAVAILLSVVLAVCFLTDPKGDSPEVVGSNYSVELVLFGSEDNVSDYCITGDLVLYSVGETVEKLGQLEKSSVKTSDINEDFKLDRITDSYSLIYGNVYYVVFKTETSETYLGKGLSPEEITELYLLKSEFKGGEADAEFFDFSIGSTIDSYVSSFSFFECEDLPGYTVVGFISGESSYPEFLTDMGYAVFTVHSDGYKLVDVFVYPDATMVKGGIYICPDPAVLDANRKMTDKNTFDVVLSCNSNLDKIIRTVKSPILSEKTGCTVVGFRTMTLFKWSDDPFPNSNRSVSMQFYGSDGEEIAVTNILPGVGKLYASSGRSQSLIYSFKSDTSIEEIKSNIQWLSLSMDGDMSEPFNVYCGNREISSGYYYLYDAETLEPVYFMTPTGLGLKPQTHILQNTVRGKSYIVLFRANIPALSYEDVVFAFGINIPYAKTVTDPFAESDTPYTWLHNVTKDDINVIYAKNGGGDEKSLGVKAIKTLVPILNEIQSYSVYPSKISNPTSVITVKCAEHTYVLKYANGLAEISFAKETSELYPEAHWIISDKALSSWFESFEDGSLEKMPSDLLDYTEDFMRMYFSFYSENGLIPMDFNSYTDISELAEAMGYFRDLYVTRENEFYSDKNILMTTSASYLDGGSDERIYVRGSFRVIADGSNFGYTFNLAFKETSKGYLITDFECYDVWGYGTQYRYGSFVYQPVDDWEKNGELYLTRIKGESVLPSVLDVGTDLLNRFEENVDNYSDVFKVYEVSFDNYDPNSEIPSSFLYPQLYSIGSNSESRGVILVFDTGRYVACIDSYVVDPLILDGTVIDYYYVDYGMETFGEYFEMQSSLQNRNSYMNAKYIVAID